VSRDRDLSPCFSFVRREGKGSLLGSKEGRDGGPLGPQLLPPPGRHLPRPRRPRTVWGDTGLRAGPGGRAGPGQDARQPAQPHPADRRGPGRSGADGLQGSRGDAQVPATAASDSPFALASGRPASTHHFRASRMCQVLDMVRGTLHATAPSSGVTLPTASSKKPNAHTGR
jgi:hypothetical protein